VCWVGSFRRGPERQSRGGQLPARHSFPWGYGKPGAAEGQQAWSEVIQRRSLQRGPSYCFGCRSRLLIFSDLCHHGRRCTCLHNGSCPCQNSCTSGSCSCLLGSLPVSLPVSLHNSKTRHNEAYCGSHLGLLRRVHHHPGIRRGHHRHKDHYSGWIGMS